MVSSLSLTSQVKIKLDIENHKDSTLYLYKYKSDNNYILIDSTNSDKNFIKNDINYPEGIYVIANNKQNPLFEILLGKDQRFSVVIEELMDINRYKIKGSKETSTYFDIYSKTYHNLIYIKALESEMKYFPHNARKIDSVKSTHNEYLKSMLSKDPTAFINTYIGFNTEIIVPQEYKDNQREYVIEHYFDNINFNDNRILNSRLLKNKLDDYFDNIILEESVELTCNKIDYILDKANDCQEVRDYILWNLYSRFFNPKDLKHEKTFIHLVDNYFSKMEIVNLTDNIRDEIIKRANVLKDITIGSIIPNLSFTDKNGDNISLEDIKSENVVIIFHKTDCVLCQKAMRILSLIKKRNKNIEIIDINITDETSNKDIIHRYNITNVPSIFVLDKDRRIICKNIKAEEVEFYLKRK